MKFIKLISVVLMFVSGFGCKQYSTDYQEKAADATILHQSMKQLTDVIVHDIFSPPVASRIYVYPSIAAYEVMQHTDNSFLTMSGQLHDFKDVPQPEEGKEYCYPLAAVHSFLLTGKAFIFSEPLIQDFHDKMLLKFDSLNMPPDVYERSLAYGEAVSKHILAWADKDNYKQSRTFSKYTFQDDPATWQPTPPAYMDGIEPHWRAIRPMILDSAQQYSPPPPTPYNLDKNSLFYKELMEVYEVLNDKKDEKIAIAQFWDCNPYVSHSVGHVMFATKKITPGGHWIGITKIACEKEKTNMLQTTEAYARVSIALMDAFISCWDEKYRSNLVRPETVINQSLDPEWKPALQTPPFPEYTSGHSVISTASALTLTDIFGENFAYNDDVEVEYGLPARQFNSFLEASQEAAVSRLYGGIHYRPAIDLGVEQGTEVGKFILANLKTRKQ